MPSFSLTLDPCTYIMYMGVQVMAGNKRKPLQLRGYTLPGFFSTLTGFIHSCTEKIRDIKCDVGGR